MIDIEDGWTYIYVSPGVNEMVSTLRHLLDQQNYFLESTEKFSLPSGSLLHFPWIL